MASATLRRAHALETAAARVTAPGAAEITLVGGVPTVAIEGQPFGPMFYTPGGRDAWERPEMARRGFRLFFEFVHEVGWPGEQEEIFRRLDERLRRVLGAVDHCAQHGAAARGGLGHGAAAADTQGWDATTPHTPLADA